MKKKQYVQPLMESDTCSTLNAYMAGDNSIPYGGGDGPGIAEGKEREESNVNEISEDKSEEENSWGNLW